ncbi:four-carbon acid sugar kinase family protein [Pseudogracilibacillus sp. SO30301A]|uniref:four-carbon acid sugar kinase family protein n=1 Tax=Pseudogracilibacillus sp. SO30301A TaxID=3098291 RepID=UPI00300E2F24
MIHDRLNNLPEYDDQINQLWDETYKTFTHKIIVLDDDPTGVQTVHGVPVYTEWSQDTIEAIFQDSHQMVFILTNSRSFTKEKTEQEHRKIAERIGNVSDENGQPYLLISRGDSTLRGHYPLETAVLKNGLEDHSTIKIDGEIISPFFQEGGRITINDKHYLTENNSYIPVGKTEFAEDRIFSFENSNLKNWIEEKTKGEFKADSVTSISIEELRKLDITKMMNKLEALNYFNKLIVNAVTEEDIKAFCIALLKVINKNNKHFLFRTAASFTKVIGNISNKPYLTKKELLKETNSHGGLIIVGSHVQKTSEQLNKLKELNNIHFFEFNCEVAHDSQLLQQEKETIQSQANDLILNGHTVCIYTSRKKINFEHNQKDKEIQFSLKISQALTSFVSNCKYKPNYVVAKGGITSSDVGTIGLAVKRAEVMGQIIPGVPVWKTGNDSRFPNIPYIIFPGNVGSDEALKQVIQLLES